DFTSQERRAGKEDDPTLEEMQEAVGHLIAPAIHQHSDQADAQAVHHDRDRDGGKKYHGTLPEWRLEQIGSQEAETEERIKIAQPGAGIGHLEFITTQINYIAEQKDRNLEHPDEEHPEVR